MYNLIDSNKRRTWGLFFIFFLLFIAVGWGISWAYDEPGILVIAVIIAVIQSWVSYFYSDKISLAATGAKEASRAEFLELHRIVENLAITAGLPKPKIYVINDPSPNAFATGRNPKNASIAVTTGLMERLDKTELEGVIAHELAHIGNYDILVMTVCVTLVGAIVLATDIALRARFWHGSDDNKAGGYAMLIALALAILAPLFAKLIQLAVSRKREYLADGSGAMLTRYPEGLASALEKIESYERPMKSANRATAHLFINEPFGVDDKKQSWLQTVFSTHPPIHDRIKRLRQG
jgi:heat shock protein HtpX